jgi:hypothetical protein
MNHKKAKTSVVLWIGLMLGCTGFGFAAQKASVNYEQVALLRWYAANRPTTPSLSCAPAMVRISEPSP